MMGKDPAMPFYVNDWLSSPRVQCMTPAQELAYFRLLAFCWASQDVSLPDDDQRLSVMSRMGEGWFNGGSHLVRECFNQHPTKDGYLTNQRLYDLWSERQEWREKSRKGGVKSGRSRRLRTTKGGSTKREPNGNSSSSSSSSSSDRKTPYSPPEGDPLFESFWSAFPRYRRTKKQKAFEAWTKAVKRAKPEVIIAATREYAESPVGRGKFVLMPTTWLNGSCWNDDRMAWQWSDSGDIRPEMTTAELAEHLGVEDVDDQP